MYTNALNYLYSYLRTKLTLKSILLTSLSVILLAGCGVKGDLYQTPDHVVNGAELQADGQENMPESETESTSTKPVSKLPINPEAEQE